MADSIGGPAWRTKRQLTPARIAGGAALRVRIMTAGERSIEGGPALPIYYVQDSELRVNGGKFTLQGNPPMPIFEAAGAIVEGRAAIPVYVTNPADGESVLLLELQADIGVTTSTASFAGTGVITQSGTTVSGVGTAFLSEVVVGDRIQAIGIDGIVQSIATNTSLTLNTSATVGVGVIYTITPQVGTARVMAWLDQSGNGHDFTQSGTARPSKQTIGGFPAVVFDGRNDWMLGSDFADNPSSFTIFIVAGEVIGSSNFLILSKINNSADGVGWYVARFVGASQLYWFNGLNAINVDITVDNHLFNLTTLEKDSDSNGTIYINGDSTGSIVSGSAAPGFSTVEPVRICTVGDPDINGDAYLGTRIRAIMIYTPALSASARAAKEQELADRYGITL